MTKLPAPFNSQRADLKDANKDVTPPSCRNAKLRFYLTITLHGIYI